MDELNSRVKGANQRARKLVGKWKMIGSKSCSIGFIQISLSIVMVFSLIDCDFIICFQIFHSSTIYWKHLTMLEKLFQFRIVLFSVEQHIRTRAKKSFLIKEGKKRKKERKTMKVIQLHTMVNFSTPLNYYKNKNKKLCTNRYRLPVN